MILFDPPEHAKLRVTLILAAVLLLFSYFNTPATAAEKAEAGGGGEAVEALGGSLDALEAKLADRRQWLSTIPAIAPVKGILTSGFGYRRGPLTRGRGLHQGIDIAAALGQAVQATADGIVVQAGVAGRLGNAVYISHGYGMTTRYGHLSRIDVLPGQQVKRGEVIGRVGNTGRSTGPHLHYEVRLDGEPVDPLAYMLDDGGTPSNVLASAAPLPAAAPRTARDLARDGEIVFVGVGDVMMGSTFPDATGGRLPPDDGVGMLAEVTPLLAAADLAFGNLEGPLLEGGTTAKCPQEFEPVLRVPGADPLRQAPQGRRLRRFEPGQQPRHGLRRPGPREARRRCSETSASFTPERRSAISASSPSREKRSRCWRSRPGRTPTT